jgi:hypothetical protein
MAELGYRDSAPFITQLEQAYRRADSDYIDANADKLRQLVAACHAETFFSNFAK